MDEDTNSKLRQLRSRPLCIICGRSSEAEELAKAFGIRGHADRIQGHEVSGMQGHTFFLGSFTLNSGEKLKYYITSSLRQGIQSFTISAALIFNILRPRFVVHSGVCAADEHGKAKMQLRDVIFGEAAINYEEGKFEKVPWFGIVFRPDYNRVDTKTGNMQSFAGSADRPNYHYGEYVSGSAVRADAGAIFAKIKNAVQRNAIALDMEASAFIQLCQHFGASGPTCLGVLKGISDFGDDRKGEDPTAYSDALWNTAKAIEEWITYQIPAITWKPDESGEPGAQIVPGYYENFVRRVLDNHVQGTEARLQNDAETTIPYGDVKGLLCVLPKGRDAGFLREMGTTQAVVSKYHIQDVSIGGRVGRRILCYKAGYFIDWCRCVNSLADYEDSTYQISVFERVLSAEAYFKPSADPSAAPLAMVVEWDDVMDWLDEVVQAEQTGTPTPRFTKRERILPADSEPPTPTAGPTRKPYAERTSPSAASSRSGPVMQKKLSISHMWNRARGKSAERNATSRPTSATP